MKSITIDFTNKNICVRAKGKSGTRKFLRFDKEFLSKFFPEDKYMTDYNSYTWDFDRDTFVVNQDKKNMFSPSGEIKYLPEIIVPMPKLSRRYREFISILKKAELEPLDEDEN